MKRFFLSALLGTMITLSSTSVAFCADTVTTPTSVASDSTEITPRKDDIRWRYTTINGELYRRQYNYTRGYWIGDWELVE